MYKVPYLPAKFIKSVGEGYQVVKMRMEYQGRWKNKKLKKGKQYHLFYDFEAVGKNIKWGRGVGDGNVGEEIQNLKKILGNFIHPCF